MNIWKCKLVFPTDTLQQINYFLIADDTSVLIARATTVHQVHKNNKRSHGEV